VGSPPRRASRRKRNDDLVAAGDFAVSVNPASLTIVETPGPVPTDGEVNGTVTVTGLNGFAGDVDLTCNVTGILSQEQPFCFFPSEVHGVTQVTVDAAKPAPTDMVVAESTPAQCVLNNPFDSGVFVNFGDDAAHIQETGFGILVVALLICSAKRIPQRQRALIFRAAFVCAVGLLMAGCRNGTNEATTAGCPSGFGFDPGTPQGAYMLTVTATSGSISHSVTVPLTVPSSQ